MSWPPEVADPAHPSVVDALTRRCEVCKAKPGRYCWNIAGPDLGRSVHYARLGPT